MNYVIIGSCIAAIGAIEGIRSIDRESQIIVIDGEKQGAYSRPLISYYLVGLKHKRDLFYRNDQFFIHNNVQVIKGKAEHIDQLNKCVILDNQESIHYDKLLLANGASPIAANIAGINEANTISFYTIDDAEKLAAMVSAGMRITIIGSGLIGLKAAEALNELKAVVTVIEKEGHLLPRILSQKASHLLTKKFTRAGIKIITAKQVLSVSSDNSVSLSSGEVLKTDLIITCLGTRPNIKLAQECGLKVNLGIITDLYLRTSDPNIFAAGDVIETNNMVNGKNEVMALLPHAHEEGYLAGCNMAGQAVEYQGNIFINAVNLFGSSICSAGSITNGQYTVLKHEHPDRLVELHLKDNQLQKYVTINFSEITGPLTTIIKNRLVFTDEQWLQLIDNPSIHHIPYSYWDEIRRLKPHDCIKCS
ncbi:MAG: NAD(P)/FAD-dependent oxidoreductase [Syntrophomonadaceae bacterium]|nr:NAD(P)/FAD-dependent oxidoreductase [Syntrophomonadaceae bacterium]